MEISFCLSSSPDKQKSISLRSLWFDSAHHPESIEGRLCGEISESLSAKICVNLRLIALNSLRISLGVLCVFAARPVEYPFHRSVIFSFTALFHGASPVEYRLDRGQMVCPKGYSTGRVIFLLLLCLVFGVAFTHQAEAGVVSGLSIALTEEFNDNIFFTEDEKSSDFITSIIPTFRFLYAPPASEVPTFKASFSSPIQIFVNNSELNNWGDNVRFNADYLYQYSPRLSFKLTNVLQRVGEGRTARRDGFEADLLTRGARVTDTYSVDGKFLYTPKSYFTGRFSGRFTNFIDEGGRESRNSLGVRGFYVWKEEHNLYAGYSMEVFKSRNGEDTVVHNFDLGDDFFSNRKIQLTPTLTLIASGGMSFASGNNRNGIASRTNLHLIKVWERASLTTGLTRRLTNNFGGSGISNTTTVFNSLNVRLTELVTVTSGATFSFLDTDDGNRQIFSSQIGIEYQINHWAAAKLGYLYRWRDEEDTPGTTNSNSVVLFLGTNFDTWPRFGLGRNRVNRRVINSYQQR